MFFFSFDVVFKEVPGEVSLCFSICGCPLQCKGCHSPYLFKKENGKFLDDDFYQKTLIDYQKYATCVLFMGGEWEKQELLSKLKIAKMLNYKTCLYSGLEDIDSEILAHLDWVKTGAWKDKLGGLDKKTTNQIFKNVKTGEVLNHLFQ
ncbi:anaerobic ribonucleoside-triphosphate reductase activating protein [Wenyingzhuangia sp. 2_MG-2023]|uniref:anaerobic ribonucleoside-triphosphate reductase activating protein n=1 Tax=Wenyingzhuangia sp. 2_MG-2023 TaxID=3062639 RepID=UPI0026E168EF|nr:anaerobic ribonucleoside-triphosphate reductase activating protein [Wenyingzhuangia sp. 2_MG-2023]MDO6737223.1 anaerobic ribonucleoside-triphosphate reductase activating protein [Wenyingzhuangia sp. 2_MG-2023]